MMKRSVLGIVLAMFLPACCLQGTPHHPTLNAAETAEAKTLALVHWVGRDSDGDPVEVAPESLPDINDVKLTAYCTAVWVSDDHVITAAHCVDDIGEPAEQKLLSTLPQELQDALGIEAWDPTGHDGLYSAFGDVEDTANAEYRTTHTFTVVAFDKAHDLALLQAKPDDVDGSIPQHLTAQLASSARVGEHVDIVGHTMGLWWSYASGYVSQVRPYFTTLSDLPDAHKMSVIQVSAPVWYGNSGGGAFNSKGELLGIMHSVLSRSSTSPGPDVSLAIPYTYVADMLRANNVR